MSMENPAHMLQ